MPTSTVSAKYQVVIPKELRKKFLIKPGQRVTLDAGEEGNIIIKTPSQIDKYYGALAGKKIWGDDPTAHIRKQRDEWEKHQKKLDNLG